MAWLTTIILAVVAVELALIYVRIGNLEDKETK